VTFRRQIWMGSLALAQRFLVPTASVVGAEAGMGDFDVKKLVIYEDIVLEHLA